MSFPLLSQAFSFTNPPRFAGRTRGAIDEEGGCGMLKRNSLVELPRSCVAHLP